MSDDEQGDPWAWLKDSAIILGGVTALLYLTSHFYGSIYLGVFNVRSGFQGFGLGNLSMFGTPHATAIVFCFTLVVSAMLTAQRWLLVLLLILIAMVAHTDLIILSYVRGGLRWSYGYAFLPSILTILIILWWRRFFTRLEKRGLELQSKLKNIDEKTNGPRSVTTDKLRGRLNRDLSRTEFRTIIYTSLLAGALTVFNLANTISHSDAILTTYLGQREMLPEPPTGKARIPVYWIGDRYVYVTNDGITCEVHEVIDSTEVGAHKCSPVIDEVSKPDNAVPSLAPIP